MISVKHSEGTFTYNPFPSTVLSGNLTGYSHQIDIIGGFDTANIAFVSNPVEMEEWIERGVGRHISVSSEFGNIVWEGLVNSVRCVIGSRTITVGNFMDIVNRVKVAYTLRNPPAGTPDADRYLETDWASDGESVRKYGVLEELITGGSGYSQEMEALRDQVLKDNLEPLISESIPSGNNEGGTVSIAIECVGYYRLLEKQTYVYGSSTEYAELAVKVKNILENNSNNIHFIFRKDIQSVGYQALLHETQRRTAWGIIKDDISKTPLGDRNIICGMFADNTFLFGPAPNYVTYRRDGGSSIIKDTTNIVVPPSEVIPGGLMENNDTSSPMYYRIKSVGYNLSSNTVQLNQNKRSIGDALSRKMLGGMF